MIKVFVEEQRQAKAPILNLNEAAARLSPFYKHALAYRNREL
jgi:hypothetical protein